MNLMVQMAQRHSEIDSPKRDQQVAQPSRFTTILPEEKLLVNPREYYVRGVGAFDLVLQDAISALILVAELCAEILFSAVRGHYDYYPFGKNLCLLKRHMQYGSSAGAAEDSFFECKKACLVLGCLQVHIVPLIYSIAFEYRWNVLDVKILQPRDRGLALRLHCD